MPLSPVITGGSQYMFGLVHANLPSTKLALNVVFDWTVQEHLISCLKFPRVAVAVYLLKTRFVNLPFFVVSAQKLMPEASEK